MNLKQLIILVVLHAYCQWFQNNMNNRILDLSFFSNESWFSLNGYHLLPDLRNWKLVDSLTHLSSPGFVLACSSPRFTTVGKTSGYHLLVKYPELTKASRPDSQTSSPVAQHIYTTSPPVAETPRRLPLGKLKTVNSASVHGWCRSSSSPWASPLHVVRKKNPEEWRPYGVIEG